MLVKFIVAHLRVWITLQAHSFHPKRRSRIGEDASIYMEPSVYVKKQSMRADRRYTCKGVDNDSDTDGPKSVSFLRIKIYRRP